MTTTTFEQRVAIVTGGGSGMGAATAVELASEGAAVVIADVNTDGGETVQQHTRSPTAVCFLAFRPRFRPSSRPAAGRS
jgi:NAD(P)-dependent dehydrogenase (short-subunit alcohol dehydrogenase family)